jgi:hypothetical protein
MVVAVAITVTITITVAVSTARFTWLGVIAAHACSDEEN